MHNAKIFYELENTCIFETYKSIAISFLILNFIFQKLFSCSSCGADGQATCASYFNTTKTIPAYKQIYRWITSIRIGYNKYEPTTPYLVKKGYYLGIYYPGSGRIALNTNDRIIYSDYQWKFNTKTLSNLPVKASRFYFNALVNSYYYKNTTVLYFESAIDQMYKVYNITFQVPGSSFSVNKSVIYRESIIIELFGIFF
jgi:hypothetical protein